MVDINKVLAHKVQLARLEGRGFREHIAPSLARTLRDIRALLSNVDQITNRTELKRLENAISAIISKQDGWAALATELEGVAIYDNRFYADMLAVTAATDDKVKRLASRTMLVLRSGERFNTGLFPDLALANLDSQAMAVNNIVRTGYANGLTGRDMRGRISSLFDGALTKHADTLARTGYAHYATVGRRALAEANPDVLTREVPIVTFDSRLSKVCASIGARYGQKGWPAGQSPIGYPPYHFYCRTDIVPLPEGEKLTGTRASKGDESGQIRASTSLDNFVRRQSKSWQDDLLGPERAALFRERRLSLSGLTDKNLRPLTLEEIIARGG